MAGIRVLFKLIQAPATPRAPYSAQYCGVTTSDTPIYGEFGGWYAPGYLVAVSAGNSMDISGGQGSLAEAIEGSISVADMTDSGVALSKAIHDGDLSFQGATVWVSYEHADGVELSECFRATVIGDPEYSTGIVTFALRSATYTVGKTFLNRFSFPEIPTKPDGQALPSDPAYPLDSGNRITTPAYSGNCFGGIPVSLKAGKGPAVQMISRWRDTGLKGGDISTASYDTNPAAFGDVAFEIGQTGSAIEGAQYNSDDTLHIAAGLLFKCRTLVPSGEFVSDITAATEFADSIQAYIDSGYRIVLSDGDWFADLLAYSHSPRPVQIPGVPILGGPDNPTGELATRGFTVIRTTAEQYDVEYPMAGVLFNLCDANGNELFRNLPSAESIRVYAVPASINVATGDKILLGVARNGKTAKSSLPQKMIGGSTFAIPSCADASGFVVPESIPAKAMVYANDLPWSGNRSGDYSKRRGFVMWEGDALTAGASSGDLADINTDPATEQTADVVTATSTRTVTATANQYGWMDLRVQSQEWGDLNMIDATIRVKATGIAVVLNSDYYGIGVYAKGPYWKRKKWLTAPGIWDNMPAWWYQIQSVDKLIKADRTPSAPNWNIAFRDEEGARQRIEIGGTNCRNTMAPTFEFSIRELFAWRFNRLSFSEIYGTVWPFWTQEYYTGAWSNAWGDFSTGSYVLAVSNSTEYAVCHLTDAGEEWAKFTLPGDLDGKAIIGGGYDLTTLAFFVIWRQQLDATGTSWRIGFESLDAAGVWQSTTTHDLTGTIPSRAWIGNGEIHFVLGSSVLRWSVAGTAVIDTEAIGSPVNRGHFNGSAWVFTTDAGLSYAPADFSSIGSVALTERMIAVTYGGLAWCVAGADGAVYVAPVATAATLPTTGWVKRFGAANIPDRYPTKEPNFWDVEWDGVKFVAVGGYYSGYSAGGSIMASGGAGPWTYADQDAGAWLAGITWCRSKWLVVGDATASFADHTLQFSPGRTPSPLTFLQKFKVDYFGGENLDSYNPLRWSGADGLTWAADSTPFAIAFDPPDAASEPPTPETAIEQVCREWWIFAGEFAGDIDASNDPIEVAFPRIVPGALEDIATVLQFSFNRFGGEYLQTAYVQNVDQAYVAGNDANYFGGWDDSGNANGLAIWQACRAAYLATGSTRRLARSFDSIHTPGTMGALFVHEDANLGRRIDWICRQPRYLELRIDGNESKAGFSVQSYNAFCGCRYKPNQAILSAQGRSLPAWGVVTSATHDYIKGEHLLQIAFAPEVPA